MNQEHYPYEPGSNFQEYSFNSVGPKGTITKAVIFTKFDKRSVYNLAFGDVNPATGLIDDKANSNNHDRDIVLATVANTIHDFSDKHGNHYIFATGSTPARTRLYQMGISGLLDEIKMDFEIWGLKDNTWHDFQGSVNYEAFMVRRK